MRIGIIASIWISNPPHGFGFGAQEYLTYHIAEGLKKKGHEVTLFASGDSKVTTKLVSITEKQLIDIPFDDQKIKDLFEIMNVSEAYKQAAHFDIFHNHLLPYGLPFADWSPTPTVHTLHHAVNRKHADIFMYERYKNQNYILISNAQQKVIPELNYIATVYNGIDNHYYRFKEMPDDPYLLYIGRMKRYKGIHTAIQLANKLNLRLKIAATSPKISQPDYIEVNEYWEKDIKPAIKGNVEYFDTIEGEEKISMLQNAKALIFPVEREEPFGMTLIEAMSCGTPVIAYGNGAVPEIVEDGKTGFLINKSPEKMHGSWTTKQTGFEGLVEATNNLYAMKPEDYATIRKNSRNLVEQKFTINRMVDSYEKVYKNVLGLV